MKNKTIREMSAADRARSSLSARVSRITLLGILVMGVVSLVLGLGLYTYALIEQYSSSAFGISRIVGTSISSSVEYEPLVKEVMDIYHSLSEEERMQTGTYEYRARFAHICQTPVYDLLLEILGNTLENSTLFDIYLAVYDWESSALVYIVDPDQEYVMFPGDWERAGMQEAEKYLKWDGTGSLYDISDTDYGWMCTAAFPLHREDGEIQAYIMADVTLEEIGTGVKNFTLQFTLALLVVTTLAAAFTTWKMKTSVVQPINAIAEAAANYASDKRNNSGSHGEHFHALNIRTGDEIENLSLVMADMERDISEYEENLAKTVAEKERISTELNVATQIQADMLPHITPEYPGRDEFTMFASMTPAKEVGGDFYDFFMIDSNHFALVMADVSGKGVPAALFMVIAKTLLKNRTLSGGCPKEILADVNNQLCEGNASAFFVTVWLAILTISTGELVAASGGHEYPAICHSGQKFELFHDPRSLPLAMMEDAEYSEARFKLDHGDALFLYTDGVTEAADSRNQFFGRQRLLDALNHHTGETPSQILSGVRKEINVFTDGAPQSDDITMLCLRYM